VRWYLDLLVRRLRSLRSPVEFEPTFHDLEEWDELLRRHAGIPLAEARVLEIGHGQRPYRLLVLLARGVDAVGVDAELSVFLKARLRDWLEMLRVNGAQRFWKTVVRHALFDARERRALRAALRAAGTDLPDVHGRLLHTDAASLDLAPASLDLVVSIDVFEHIARESLEALVPRMRTWLRPGGLALIEVGIYTGIRGGHRLEWDDVADDPARKRPSAPWEHLRDGRVVADTFLNELRRDDYRELFSQQFDILQEVDRQNELGRDLLIPAVRAELAAYSDEDLLSNLVLFVLRPR
jgi:hypothetical protein